MEHAIEFVFEAYGIRWIVRVCVCEAVMRVVVRWRATHHLQLQLVLVPDTGRLQQHY